MYGLPRSSRSPADRRTSIRLSAFAATTLINENYLSLNDLKLYRPREYLLDDGPSDPVSASIVALLGATATGIKGVADVHEDTYRAMRSQPDRLDSARRLGIGKEPSVTTASPDSTSEKAKSVLERPSLGSVSTPAQPRNESVSQLFLNAAGRKTATASALPGYVFQGIYKELRNKLGPGIANSIIAARTVQGIEDWTSSTRDELMEVLRRWQVIQH
ncbi:MAG: hypothetical protein L6R35_006556 [Caloplaca aegaea]|nr:MAG: hypothetical protein L6R35_006556 [Caloplaca aegaea]